MNHPLSLLAAIGLALGAAAAQAQMTPTGVWKTIDDGTKKEKSLVRIREAGGIYTGVVEKVLDPDVDQKMVCEKCGDERKDKPIVGLTIIKGVKQDGDDKARFDGGEILDPNNGKTYKVRLTPTDGGKTLEVRGFIGPFYRNQTWIRVE